MSELEIGSTAGGAVRVSVYVSGPPPHTYTIALKSPDRGFTAIEARALAALLLVAADNIELAKPVHRHSRNL